jgi:predicted phage terminase large subunit-like protein
MDDPMGTTATSSEAERRKAVETFREAIRSRLNSKTGRIVLVMQRVHFHDLAGYLIEQGGYEVLRIPAIAEEDVTYDLGGGQFYLHPKGSLIDPRRFDMAELELTRRDMGSDAFECQYLQRPRLPDGQIIKMSWLKLVDVIPDFEQVFVSADIAGSDERGDYSVFLVWGVRDGIWYVTHIYRQRWEFAELIKLVERIDRDHEPVLIVVERNGLGASFLSRARELGLTNVDGMTVKMSKADRAHAVTPLLEQGKVSILRTIPTLETFLEELLSFPSSKFSDQVDAFTLPLHRHQDVTRMIRNPGWVERQKARRRPQGSEPSASLSAVRTSRVGGTYFNRNLDNPFLG